MSLKNREERRSFVTACVSKGSNEAKEKLVQKSYYLTPELIKAITLKTAEGELDKSGVIREALKAYLKDYLEPK